MEYFMILPVLLVVAGLVYSSVCLVKNPTRTVAWKVKTQVNVWMVVGFLAFLGIGLYP